MKKKLYFIRFALKDGDNFYFYSHSKRRVKKQSDIWYEEFRCQISLVSSNFMLV